MLVFKSRTETGRNRDALLVAEVRLSDGPVFTVALFSDDIVRLPPGLPMVARVPDGKGSNCLVPVRVRLSTDKATDLGTVDVCMEADDRSVVRYLPEVVRDHRHRRWLRPQKG